MIHSFFLQLTPQSSSGCELRSFEQSKTSVLPNKLFVIQSFALGCFYVEDKDAASGGELLPQSNYERVSCESLSLIFMYNHNIEITEQSAASAHRQTDKYPHRLLSFSEN